MDCPDQSGGTGEPWRVDAMIDADLRKRLTRRAQKYDKRGLHYNLISALHKSVRGSDPDAALYLRACWRVKIHDTWPHILRMAVEDIGLADPQAQAICIGA